MYQKQGIALFFVLFFLPMLAWAGCQNIKKINNLDDLLSVFCDNLDTDCIFEMPLHRLEKKLGIAIFSEERLREEWIEKNRVPIDEEALDRHLRAIERGSLFRGKRYRRALDLFYLKAENRGNIFGQTFTIQMTLDAQSRFGSLIVDGNFPKRLPPPFVMNDERRASVPNQERFKLADISSGFANNTEYYWLAPKDRYFDGAIFLYTNQHGQVNRIVIWQRRMF